MKITRRINQILILSILIFSLYVTSPVTSDDPGITLNTADDPDFPGVFKVLNYNILEGGKIDNDDDGVKDWLGVLDVENADVLLLSETGRWAPGETLNTAIDEINARFPDEIPYAGYTFNPDSLTDGQAILSRYPIVSHKNYPTLFLDDGTEYTMSHELMEVVIDVDGLEIYLYAVHFTCCGGGFPTRMKEMEAIINHFDTLGNVPIIYGGDFNSDSPADEEYIGENSDLGDEPLVMLLNSSHAQSSTEHDFLDMYRYLNPANPGYTYIDPLYQSRLDYLFINEPLYDAMVNSTALDFYEAAISGSDHMPMTGVFNLQYDEIDLAPPLPVANVEVDVESTQATITWDPNQDVDFYKYSVYRNDCLITDLEKGVTSFVDDYEYESNAIYIYDVSATDLTGHESLLSNEVYINTSSSVLAKPSTPVLSSSLFEAGKILLEWTVDNDGGYPIDFFQLYRSNSVDGPWSLISTQSADNATKAQDNRLVLYYRVRAHNYLGYSSFSNYVSDDISTLLNTEATTNTVDNPAFSTNIRDQPSNCPVPLVILEAPEVDTTTSSSISISSTPTDTETTPFPIAGIFVFLTIVAILPIKRRNN